MPATYPKRPPFFSHRFMRVLLKSCAVLEIGPSAAFLLAVVVNTEDAKRYTGEVFFWNDHLRSLAGFRSEDALATARKRLIEAGWLHYEPGGKHRAGRYWVTIPSRLEVLDDAPLGEDGSLIETTSARATADRQRAESGSTAGEGNLNPRHSGSTAGGERFDSGSTADHSTLSLPLTLSRENATRGAAEPRLDPDEQDITTPTKPSADVPRGDAPRGTENDRVTIVSGKFIAVTRQDPVHGLGVWIRWRANDASRQDENAATIRALIIEHGATVVQRVAERLQREGAADRDRKPGDKVWVDELLPAILAEQVSRSQASGSTNGTNPPDDTPQPEIVTQAHALLASRGAAACRFALGWGQHVAPTDAEMRTAIARCREMADGPTWPVASELVDVMTNGPAVVVE